MSIEYVPVSENEQEEPIELPTEEDGSLLLSTVTAQFAGASGLKYRAGATLRGLRLVDERLSPPPGGWAQHRYWCAFPRPPHAAGGADALQAAVRRPSDLIVLGLPWKTGEEAVREYFSAFGDLVMVQVKRDAKTGLSKGFGFIKFAEYESQARALGRRHMIDGRWCDVRIPNGKEGGAGGAGAAAHRKVFVGRCTESLTAEDLRDYFAAFGQVTDVFVPRPFRAFSFVTFLEAEVAQSLCGQDHIIKGVSVNISTASPKRTGGGAGPASRDAPRGAPLLGWGLVEAGGTRMFNWAGDAWPPPHHDTKPYLKRGRDATWRDQRRYLAAQSTRGAPLPTAAASRCACSGSGRNSEVSMRTPATYRAAVRYAWAAGGAGAGPAGRSPTERPAPPTPPASRRSVTPTASCTTSSPSMSAKRSRTGGCGGTCCAGRGRSTMPVTIALLSVPFLSITLGTLLTNPPIYVQGKVERTFSLAKLEVEDSG